jgi:histidine triad (HIT) family protein
VASDDTFIVPSDFIYEDELVTALVNSFFVPNNSGHIIVVPNQHFEHIYDLPDEYANRITKVVKHVALALKQVRNCDGITVLQNNEPAGGQKAFHSHTHIYPRFIGDDLHNHIHNTFLATAEQRQPYADALKEYFKTNSTNQV